MERLWTYSCSPRLCFKRMFMKRSGLSVAMTLSHAAVGRAEGDLSCADSEIKWAGILLGR